MCQWKFLVLTESANTSARSTVRAAEISLVALEPRLLGVSSGASRRFLASSILILVPPSGLMQSYCARRMALNKWSLHVRQLRGLQVACVAAPRIEHRPSWVCSLQRARIQAIVTWLAARGGSLAARRSRRAR